ncbi:MAG TPA: PEP-CTERM-box response regulator transcription factor [Candidatus Acidoferrales bacterium]|jgi:two-component system NtrC family response regulator|nr:PEP-CTERM-box response regulator transcription factor [Candidatus Acidoferrales bacterium]
MNPKLLIVDDDEEIRTQMKWALAQDYDVTLAENRAAAVEAFRTLQPMVVLLDLGLPPNPNSPEEGLAILSELLGINALVKVVIISGQGEKQNALQAIGAGAYDFLTKPVNMEELKFLLKRSFHTAQLEKEYNEMQKLVRTDAFEGVLGESTGMRAIFDSIRKVATTDAPVLILGESGTGKEMAAKAIHQRSNRKDGPFVAINCGAIPETLLESELFGHEKGAFTGAHVQRKGRIESANAGTLFLDEIGEIPLALQVKLLRFLQEQTIERVGGRQSIQINTRVVAATNVDLKKAMSAGKFREDLYYRLAVVQVFLPPLRERENDVRLLAQYFLNRFAAEVNKPSLTFDAEAVKALNRHAWPGNVRELENCVRRAVIMAEGKRVTAKDLELKSADPDAGITTLKDAREAVERRMVQQALKKHGGKIAPAAVELGMSRPTLYELMEKLGISRE